MIQVPGYIQFQEKVFRIRRRHGDKDFFKKMINFIRTFWVRNFVYLMNLKRTFDSK